MAEKNLDRQRWRLLLNTVHLLEPLMAVLGIVWMPFFIDRDASLHCGAERGHLLRQPFDRLTRDRRVVSRRRRTVRCARPRRRSSPPISCAKGWEGVLSLPDGIQ